MNIQPVRLNLSLPFWSDSIHHEDDGAESRRMELEIEWLNPRRENHTTGRAVIKKVLLPTIFIVLTYGFWISPDFKEIAAGVAIFLFGMLALEEGFRAFTGGVLERLLRKTTDKLWKSLSLF